MASPWKITSSLKEEPELSEIMSEQLSQRLQIEDDFVWVDVPEAQKVKDVGTASISDKVSPDFRSSIESSIAQNVKKIVQSEMVVNVISGDEGGSENIDYDEYTDMYVTDIEEELDSVDDWECKIDSERPVNMLKAMYPMPQWLKQKEHGTTKHSSDNKNQNIQKDNPLLPKIKFGASTTAVLERLIDNRYLGRYNQVIGTGKNSIVFHAHCHRNNCITMPFNNAVKVYKLSSNKERDILIFKRVQREFEHLKIIMKHNTNRTDTEPIRAWENVIVMSFIGFEKTISPSIQDLPLHNGKDRDMYLAIVSFMHRCYNVMHLVHGKLCVQNIRCWFERPHFIGWGHSVKTNHPRALAKLIRDCQFVSEFYAKRGVDVNSTEDLFKDITGCTKISSKLLDVINTRDLYDRYNQNPNRRSPSPKKVNNNLRFKCN